MGMATFFQCRQQGVKMVVHGLFTKCNVEWLDGLKCFQCRRIVPALVGVNTELDVSSNSRPDFWIRSTSSLPFLPSFTLMIRTPCSTKAMAFSAIFSGLLMPMVRSVWIFFFDLQGTYTMECSVLLRICRAVPCQKHFWWCCWMQYAHAIHSFFLQWHKDFFFYDACKFLPTWKQLSWVSPTSIGNGLHSPTPKISLSVLIFM